MVAMKKNKAAMGNAGHKRPAKDGLQSNTSSKKKRKVTQGTSEPSGEKNSRKHVNGSGSSIGANTKEAGKAKLSKFERNKGKTAAGVEHQDKLAVKKTAAHKIAAKGEKLSRKTQKQLMREKKAKKSKNFALTQEVVHVWERMRQHDVTNKERAALITKVLEKVKGRIPELASSHVASRIIQSCAKYGTAAERKLMLEEIKPKFMEVAKSLYGHFVVQKLVSTASKEDIADLLKVVRGHVPHLLRHPSAAHVITELYDKANVLQRDALAAEFYGKNFVLFQLDKLHDLKPTGGSSKLHALLSSMDQSQRRSVIQSMSAYVLPIIEKGLVDPSITHRLIYEYLENAPSSAVHDVIQMLSGDMMMRMVHTKEGAGVGCMLLAYGTPKDRKMAVRAMKGHVMTMAVDDYAHLVLCTALTVLDDTALLKKVIVSELVSKLREVIDNKHGYRVIAQILHPDCPRYLPPLMLALARPPIRRQDVKQGNTDGPQKQGGDLEDGSGVTSDGDQSGDEDGAEDDAEIENKMDEGDVQKDDNDSDDDDDDDDDNDDNEAAARRSGKGGSTSSSSSGILGVSRKDPLVRRRELLGGGAGSLAMSLCQTCREGVGELMRTAPGSAIVVEVMRGSRDGVLLDAVGSEELSSVHDALSECAAQSLSEATEDGDSILTNYFGSRALRLMILSSSDEGKHGATALEATEKLWNKAIKPHWAQLVNTHAAKVVAAFLKAGSKKLVKEASKQLQPVVEGDVEAWAESFVSKPPAKKQANVAQ